MCTSNVAYLLLVPNLLICTMSLSIEDEIHTEADSRRYDERHHPKCVELYRRTLDFTERDVGVVGGHFCTDVGIHDGCG